MLKAFDCALTMEVLVADRACACTLYGPAVVQTWDAEVVPVASQPELAPSPQVNMYCSALPRLEVEPPLVYVYETPGTPVPGPVGVVGVEIVSGT